MERLNSQFFQIDSRVRCTVHDLQASPTTRGRVTINQNGAGESLRNYANRYWELYNEIGGGNEKIAVSTFRMGLPEDSDLRESLTRKPPEDMRQLMRRIKEYKRLEDGELQNKGKAPVINHSQHISLSSRP